MGIVTGGSTLALYFMAADTKDAYEPAEQYLNLAASSLAIIFGTFSLLAKLGGKPDAPEEAPLPEDVAPEDLVPQLM